MGLISRVSSRTYRHESKVAKEANASIEAKATKDASTIQVIFRFQVQQKRFESKNFHRWGASSFSSFLLHFSSIVFTDKKSLHTPFSKTTPSVSDNFSPNEEHFLMNLLV